MQNIQTTNRFKSETSLTYHKYFEKNLWLMFLGKKSNFRAVQIHFVIALLAFFLSINTTWSQSVIIGIIVDETFAPFQNANVTLCRTPESPPFKVCTSDSIGRYRFNNVAPGQYFIKVMALAHKTTEPKSVVVTKPKETYIVDRVVISPALLKETTITLLRPIIELEMDKLIINVEKSVLAGAGGSALDVLERSPGISVDRQGNVLSLNGKSSVMVMINGKLNRMPIESFMQQLAGMQTSSVSRVEIMTNPSSKWDAEGDAGIINIVLRKNTQQGINGNYAFSVGYSYVAKGSASGALNYMSSKLSVFADYSYAVDHLWQLWQFDWQSSHQQTLASSTSYAHRDAVVPVHTARAGFEYNLNKRLTISGLVSGFNSKWRMNAVSDNYEIQSDVAMKGSVITHEVNLWQHMVENIGLKYLKNKTELTLDVDYLRYNNWQPTEYQNNFTLTSNTGTLPDHLAIDKRTTFSLLVAKVDWAHTMRNGWKVEAGFKRSDLSLRNRVITKTQFGSSSGWKVDSLFSQQTSMSELIQAGYITVNRTLSKKWRLQAGLRGESTRTFLTTAERTVLVDRNYFNFFPSLFLTYNKSDHQNIQFSFSRRITRPPYKVLAPTMIFIGPNTIRTGNPVIRPTLTDAVQLNYRFKDTYLLSIKYGFDRNQFYDYQPQIVQIGATVRQVFNTQNIDKSHSATATFAFPIRITNWWQSQTQAMAIWQQLKTHYGNSYLSFRQFFGQLNTTNSYKLWKGATAEATAFYNTPSQSMGLFKRRAYGSLNLGMQQTIGPRSTFRISVADLLWTNKRIGNYSLASEGIQSYTAVIYEPRVVRIGYSHTFGIQKLNTASRRKTGSEEELNRAN